MPQENSTRLKIKYKKKIRKLKEELARLTFQLQETESFYLEKIKFYKFNFTQEKENLFEDFELLTEKYLNLLKEKNKSFN